MIRGNLSLAMIATNSYVLGILWVIGRYSDDNGRYFFLRHKDWYYLDIVRQELNVTAKIHQVMHKGKPQYRLKASGFEITVLQRLGWQPRWDVQRVYPKITEHRDLLRAYLEIHSRVDTLTITKRDGRKQKQPRLRVYGNRAFLEEMSEVIAAETGAGVKKVQKATNRSGVSGILYYTSRVELQSIFNYLYQPGTKLFNRDRYNDFQEIINQFK